MDRIQVEVGSKDTRRKEEREQSGKKAAGWQVGTIRPSVLQETKPPSTPLNTAQAVTHMGGLQKN